MSDIVEDRRIYEVDGRYWMVLTLDELREWQTAAPHLVRYIDGEACSEVTLRRKVKEFLMPSIDDWAAKAARRIMDDAFTSSFKQERIAAIIATFAEPLTTLLMESRREHYHCDDSWYCCGKCDCGCDRRSAKDWPTDHEHGEDCYPSTHPNRTSGVCDCGADAWNTRVDDALSGLRG